MGGMGGGMGGMGGGMGGMGGGMGGMGGGMMMRYSSVPYSTGMRQRTIKTGMVKATPISNARYQPPLVNWRRTLRLKQPIMFNWN